MKKYRGAIIGCGLISSVHARAYRFVSQAELVAFCDKNMKACRQLKKELETAKVYQNYEQMFAQENLDFVEVLTPHSSHLKIVKQAAQRDLAINLQKPPTVSLQEFDQLMSVVNKFKLKLRVFENFRYYEPYQFAKEMILGGEIGHVKTVYIKKWGALQNALHGGWPRLKAYAWRRKEKENYQHPTVFDDGYHKHSLIEYFLGERISQIRAWCGYEKLLPRLKADSPAHVEYVTQNNKLGVFQTVNSKIEIKNNFYPCDELIEITGSKGLIMIFGGHGLLFSQNHNSPIKQGVYWFGQDGFWHFSNKMNLEIRDSFVSGLNEFIQFIKGELPEKNLIFNIKDAESCLKAGLGIIKSLRNENSLVSLSDLT